MSRYFGEFLGTFALVFAGTGAIVVNDLTAPFVGATLATASCRLMRTGDCCTVIDAAVSGCPDEVS